MASRKNRKSAKKKMDNQQRKNDVPRRQDGAVDIFLMRKVLLEQVRINTTGTPEGECVKTDTDDPFVTNPMLRQILNTFLAKVSALRHSEETGWKPTGVTKDCTKSIQAQAKPILLKKVNGNNQDHIFAQLARPQHRKHGAGEDDVALLKEMLIAQERTRTFAKSLQSRNNVAGIRRTREAEIDPLSNESLLHVMPEFLAAVKQGKITIAETLTPTGMHDAQPTRTVKLMLATFLEKSVTFHMPYPGVHIDGVPDEDDQEKPLESRVRQPNRIRGFGRVIYKDTTESS